MQSDWDASAEAWIESLGAGGDFSRAAVLDRPMMAAVRQSGAQWALDVGCGEGRFCRMMAEAVPEVVGIDPTARLLTEARQLGGAVYHEGVGENLPYEEGAFDLVVSYLSLIDIADSRAAISEMARVSRPGGHILIGNLNSWVTAAQTEGLGIQRNAQGHGTLTIVDYLKAYPVRVEWAGIRIKNWHRPLAQYMQEALQVGLQLVDFQEPLAEAGWSRSASYNHTPYLWMQLWRKPPLDL
mgnify:FL=1